MESIFIDEIKTISIFAKCDDDVLLRLLDSPYRRQQYVAGKLIASVGDPCKSLMLLTKGSADTQMMNNEGREVPIEHIEAPQLLAPMFLFSTKRIIPVDVIASTDCCIWHINREAFVNLMTEQPQILVDFLQSLSDRGQFLSNKVYALAIKGLRNRVLDYLTLNDCIHSVSKAALQLGVTRPSLSRVLSEMLSNGTIVKTSKGYMKR